jgi:hypothetical protein
MVGQDNCCFIIANMLTICCVRVQYHSRNAGSRIGEYLERIVPTLLTFCEPPHKDQVLTGMPVMLGWRGELYCVE